jgi:hypothetical protein
VNADRESWDERASARCLRKRAPSPATRSFTCNVKCDGYKSLQYRRILLIN